MLFHSLLPLTSVLFVRTFAQTSSGSNSPTVLVSHGALALTGIYIPTYQQDAFLGIPYAQPPIGELRFMKPQRLSFSGTSAKDVKTYGKACMQKSERKDMSEDCLFLNGMVVCFFSLLVGMLDIQRLSILDSERVQCFGGEKQKWATKKADKARSCSSCRSE